MTQHVTLRQPGHPEPFASQRFFEGCRYYNDVGEWIVSVVAERFEVAPEDVRFGDDDVVHAGPIDILVDSMPNRG